MTSPVTRSFIRGDLGSSTSKAKVAGGSWSAMYPLGCDPCMSLKTPLTLGSPHVMASTGKSAMETMVWCLLVEVFDYEDLAASTPSRLILANAGFIAPHSGEF